VWVGEGGGGGGLRGEGYEGELEEFVVLSWGEGWQRRGEGIVGRDGAVGEDAEEVVVLFGRRC